MHVDQPGTSGVEEQIDRLRFSHTAVAGERQRIGAVQADLVTGADQRFELGDDARAPGARLFDLCHPVFEKLFVNGCHRSAPDDNILSASPGLREVSAAGRPAAPQPLPKRERERSPRAAADHLVTLQLRRTRSAPARRTAVR